MDNNQLVVGTKDCPLKTVISILRQSSAIQDEWSTFARELEVSSSQIKKLRSDLLLLDKITYDDLLFEVLETWIGKNGNQATLTNLLQVVEGTCGAFEVGEKLRLEYKIPGKEPHVLIKGLPAQLSYYINRTIIAPGNIFSDQIFDKRSTDIFLFTGMGRLELSKLAKDKLTGNSREQLQSGVNVKFIILDKASHFEKIAEKTHHPVHLIKREGEGKWTWVKSKGGMSKLRKYLGQNEQDEERFCQMCTSKSVPVLICDSPGMGKSVLLGQIGHRLVQLYPDRSVIFIVLSELIKLAKSFGMKDKLKMVELTLGGWTGEALLQSMLNSDEGNISIELLLDGYDEVDSADRKLALEILQTISSSFKGIRLWITSRPHLTEELEYGLSILSNNVRPFHEENQVHFLTSFWSRKLMLDPKKLELFAKQCLKSLKTTMSSTDNDIAGIPLQCLLIGEVYEDDAIEYAKLDEGNETSEDSAPEIEIGTITNLYHKLVNKKLAKYKSSFENANLSEVEMMTIHSHLSLEQLFPLEHKNLSLREACEVDIDEVIKGGILTVSTTGGVTFMHRTLAEYFVAWFVFDKLQRVKELTTQVIDLLFEIMRCPITRWERLELLIEYQSNPAAFEHPVICYFLNSLTANLQLEILAGDFPSILDRLKFAWIKTFKPALIEGFVEACVAGNFVQIFKLFDQRHTFDKLSGNFFNVGLLLLSVRNSSVALLKGVLAHLERYKPFDLKVQQLTLREAVKHGKFSILEFLIKEKGLRGLVENFDNERNLVCDCIEDTMFSSEEEIKERILVLQALVGIKRSLVDFLDPVTAIAPLLSNRVHVKLLIELVGLGANVLVQDDFEETFLHETYVNTSSSHIFREDYHKLVMSIAANDLEKLVRLETESGDTPLRSILREFDPLPETLHQFQLAGADFNHVSFGESVLTVALKSGRNAETIRTLVHLGPGLNGMDKEGNTPLHLVAQYHHKLSSPDRYLIFEHLLEKGSNPNAQNNRYQTPFHVFLRNKDMDMDIFRLFKSIWDERSLWTPPLASFALGYAVNGEDSFPDKDWELFVRECEALGAYFNWTDGNRNSLLHLAIKKGKVSRVKYLIKKGLNVNSLNGYGQSPLHLAAESTNQNTSLELIACLIKNGADPMEITDRGESILHFAAKGTPAALKYFLELGGVDVNGKDSGGDTPFHYVVRFKNDEINCLGKCRLLLQYGADVNALDAGWGNTPLKSARIHHDTNKPLIELLQKCSNEGTTERISVGAPRYFSKLITALFCTILYFYFFLSCLEVLLLPISAQLHMNSTTMHEHADTSMGVHIQIVTRIHVFNRF